MRWTLTFDDDLMVSCRIMLLSKLCAALLLSLLSFSTWADVWGYLDDKGAPHFSSEKLDERYELFFRSNAVLPGLSDDKLTAKDGAMAASPPYPRAVNVPSVPPKLLAFFEVSASYKGVRHLMREASTAHNIDIELLQALIVTESGFDSQAVSPKGAVGLMQVMPATAERFGVMSDAKTPIEKKLADPQTNIKAGARFLHYLINMFPGRLELALAAYNAGEGAVKRAGNTIPKYKETQDYVKTVMQLYTLLKPPALVADQRRISAAGAGRLRLELPGMPEGVGVSPVPGGAFGRANMVSPLLALDTLAARSAELNFEP